MDPLKPELADVRLAKLGGNKRCHKATTELLFCFNQSALLAAVVACRVAEWLKPELCLSYVVVPTLDEC